MDNRDANQKRTNISYRSLFVFTIFYTATYSSSLLTQRLSQPIFGFIRYILVGFMLILFLYRFLFFNQTRNRLLITLALGFFCIFNLFFHYGTVVMPIVIFCLYVMYLDKREVIYSYMFALSLCVILIVFLSLIGILPIRTDNNLLAYGFSNPNGLGGFLAVIFMSYLYLHWDTKGSFWYMLLYLGAITCNCFILGDRTAGICMAFYLFFYFVRHDIKKTNIFGYISVYLPILLVLISLLLAYIYGKYAWTYTIDRLLTRRPYTWNYYLNFDGIHLLPNKMNIVKANEAELQFYGKNINVLLTGSFDGGYMFLLLRMGLINTVLIISTMICFARRLLKEHDVALQILLITFQIFAFTENTYIVPYGFYASYLIVICFCYSGNSYEKKGYYTAMV